MTSLATGALFCLAIALAYFFVMVCSAAFQKSRCCNAKLRYTMGWDYNHDGRVCTKCGMMQD